MLLVKRHVGEGFRCLGGAYRACQERERNPEPVAVGTLHPLDIGEPDILVKSLPDEEKVPCTPKLARKPDHRSSDRVKVSGL